MNNDKRTTRELAIEWWFNLDDYTEKQFFIQKNNPNSRGIPALLPSEIEEIFLSEHPTQPEQTIKEQSKTIEELKEENKLLREALNEIKSTFYMNICRAYNAGKGNALEMVSEGKKMGESLISFQSSHDYFIGEFPEFKTNVP